jgi:hypothetical protein
MNSGIALFCAIMWGLGAIIWIYTARLNKKTYKATPWLDVACSFAYSIFSGLFFWIAFK